MITAINEHFLRKEQTEREAYFHGHFEPKYFETDVNRFATALMRENTHTFDPFNCVEIN
jgi:hypothetical protein